jgi:outer membrane biosynthesis protein TonB
MGHNLHTPTILTSDSTAIAKIWFLFRRKALLLLLLARERPMNQWLLHQLKLIGLAATLAVTGLITLPHPTWAQDTPTPTPEETSPDSTPEPEPTPGADPTPTDLEISPEPTPTADEETPETTIPDADTPLEEDDEVSPAPDPEAPTSPTSTPATSDPMTDQNPRALW